MKLLQGHALGLWLSSSAAMLAVLLGGNLPVVCWLALSAPALASARMHRPQGVWEQTLGTLIGVGSVALALGLLVSRGLEVFLPAAAVLLLGTLAARLVSRNHLTHDMQALLLSLLLVFAGA